MMSVAEAAVKMLLSGRLTLLKRRLVLLPKFAHRFAALESTADQSITFNKRQCFLQYSIAVGPRHCHDPSATPGHQIASFDPDPSYKQWFSNSSHEAMGCN